MRAFESIDSLVDACDALTIAVPTPAHHVYFPDPWWKSRHKKRRVLNDAFLRDVVRTLAVGGRLHFWTDVEEYFQTTLELIAATVKLRGPMPVEEKPAEHVSAPVVMRMERQSSVTATAMSRNAVRRRANCSRSRKTSASVIQRCGVVRK